MPLTETFVWVLPRKRSLVPTSGIRTLRAEYGDTTAIRSRIARI